MIDEAHHLSSHLLEEVRLWGNLEAHDRKALQVVLVADPQVVAILSQAGSTALSRRISTRIRLESLTPEESEGYLAHHLRAAGGSLARLFADEAIDVICRVGKGYPVY